MEDAVRQAAEALIGTALATSSETVRIATSDVANALWVRLKGMFVRAGGPSDFGEGEEVPLAEVVDALERAHARDPQEFAKALTVTSSPVTGIGNAVGGSHVNVGGDLVGRDKITG